MSLWQAISDHQGTALLSDTGTTLSYAQLRDRVQQQQAQLGQDRQLVLLLADNTAASIIAYLACLAGQHPVILLPAASAADTIATICQRYRPHWLIQADGEANHQHTEPLPLAAELAVLLSTSGSSGQAKLVRLSHTNLAANAASICHYLGMHAADRAITALPMAHAYGLSVINSHLYCGASLFLTQASITQAPFWQALKEQAITQLPGVPYSYEIYERLGLRRRHWPSLRLLTQAGGKLPAAQVLKFAQWTQAEGIAFYVMYGQTEATARIAYLPPELALAHPDSIGIPIPGGELTIVDSDGNTLPEGPGELRYTGPNVMLGYAQSLADLAAPSPPEPVLDTGDLGYRDSNGLFYVTGRRTRQIKLAGSRWQLDALEQSLLEQGLEVLCCGTDEHLCIACCGAADPAGQRARVQRYLQETQRLHPSQFEIRALTAIPRTDGGKVDYPALTAQFGTTP